MYAETEAVYYHTGNVFAQDAMILAKGNPDQIDQAQGEYWGAIILYDEVTGGEVMSIDVSFDDGATWRAATEKEFKALEKEAQEEINIEAFENYCEEL